MVLALLTPVLQWAVGSRHDVFDTGLTLFNQGRFADAIPYFEDATHDNPGTRRPIFISAGRTISESNGERLSRRCAPRSGLSPRDAQEEIINLIIDAGFAAAINDFKLGDIIDSPRRSKEIL